MKDKKFQDFASVDKQAWIDQAKKDLKGADFETSLVSMAMEGFPIHPYYAAEDTTATQWIKSYDNKINPVSDIPGTSPRYWVNAVEVGGADESETNEEIKLVLDNGADGLILPLAEGLNFDRIFKEISLQYISLWVKPSGDIAAGLHAFADWVNRQDLASSDLRGGVLWDGLKVGFDQPIKIEEQIGQADSIHQLFKPFPNFKSICLDTSVYPNAGGTAVQEIGYGLAALVELLDGLTEKGARPEDLLFDFFVYTAVGSDYFMEIAKLKALRIALHQLAGLYRVNLPPEEVQLFAVTSRWSKSAEDPYNNLLRNTTEAMAAIIGGCHSLFVVPHDRHAKKEEVFSKRMARNISSILKEESYFDKTIDPAAGSYFVEYLIQSLYDQGLALLKKMESEGGWWKGYNEGHIQCDIKATRNQKFRHLVQGQVRGVGLAQGASADVYTDPSEENYQLKSYSHAFPFENAL